MIVGVMIVDFKINDSFSLKDKRSTLRSLIEKTKRMFNVSVSEVDNNDVLNFATVGLSVVDSKDGRFIESVFDKILNFWQNSFDIEIVDVRRDFL